MRPRILSAVAVVAVVAGAWAGAAGGQGVRPARPGLPEARDEVPLWNMTMSVERTAKGVTVRCQDSSYVVLDCPRDQRCARTIDEQCVPRDDVAGQRRGRLRLVIESVKGSVDLNCKRGCMWIRHSLPCAGKQPCSFYLNAFGVGPTSAVDVAKMRAERAQAVARRLAAEKKPDFSGRWILDDPASAPPGAAQELVVRQWLQNPRGTEPDVRVARVLDVERHTGGNVQSERFIDGSMGGVVGSSDSSWSSRHWEGDTFVVDDSRKSSPESGQSASVEHRETFALDARGRLVVTTTDRVASDTRTVRLVYRRSADSARQ